MYERNGQTVRARRLDPKRLDLAAPEHDLGLSEQRAAAATGCKGGDPQIERTAGIDDASGGASMQYERNIAMADAHQRMRQGLQRRVQCPLEVALLCERAKQQPFIGSKAQCRKPIALNGATNLGL